ncbi:MAG: hypothetical protein Q4F72_03235, partial [Desulfovibrionaceae bacterium]|nr:hypothetical protein [Desulfovibrionaceae bacterium]
TPDTRSVNSNLMNTMFDCASMCAPLLCGGVLSAGFDYHAVILVGAVSISCSGLFFACDSLRQRRRAAGPAQAGR